MRILTRRYVPLAERFWTRVLFRISIDWGLRYLRASQQRMSTDWMSKHL